MNSTSIHPAHSANRTALVSRLLAVTPLVETIELREALAVAIETSGRWQTLLVTAAGERRWPSDETWAELVRQIRARPLASETDVCRAAFARRSA